MLCCDWRIKIEASFSQTPIWCIVCKCNISLKKIPVSIHLQDELTDWNHSLSSWLIDNQWNTIGEFFELESRHNQWGAELTRQIRREMTPGFSVVFAPSNLSQYIYA